VVEGPTAGGHNAPPRGPRRTDALGQPVYGEPDRVDLSAVTGLGLPVWLAGSYGSPAGLAAARAAGAHGIQVGTAFAYTAESGLADDLKRKVLAGVQAGTHQVLTDWRASPTGFPFKVVQCGGSLSDPEVVAQRRSLCDLGVLRTPYKTASGTIDYRCPAEPARVYLGRKGGRAANTEGRRCICNALLAAADLPQRRPHGYLEPPIVTSGNDFTAVEALHRRRPPGAEFYSAKDVVDYLRGG
jgi:NAD(P)H-dependent flavin oxidoreductase YrpB (nitropropane dioxygenase family)